MEFIINKIEDWQNIIKEILPKIEHNIFLLKGNLGAGKTTFTQFLLKELGSTDEVSSPTYTIVNEYDTSKGKVFHFDLYRLKNADEVEDIGMQDYLDHSFLCLIEWPEIYEDEFKNYPFHEMSIENTDDCRVVNFE
jgi:tRNA threonylcarbamoyladenosine biosynthesis protein TsaE